MYGIESLLTGRTLVGRYRVEGVIGRGGMGAVYRGRDERLGRAVAVKVVSAPTASEAEHARLRARFQREARTAAGLHHPNVVQVYDFGTDPELGLDFLVMELLQGEDLAARLARTGSPPLPVALSILRQAALGLAAGHRAGMVHRDVKPGNLFLESGDHPDEPRVRVLDFGIAQVSAEDGAVTQLTEVGRSPYSPAYASPEQLRGDDGVTAASDVFSLAAVGYHLLTGKRAFSSQDPVQMAMELSSSLLALEERAPHLPGAVRAALLRALSRIPQERFPHAAAFADALAPGARPQPTQWATPVPSARPTPTPTPEDETRLYEVPSFAETRLYEKPAPSPTRTAFAEPTPAGARTELFRPAAAAPAAAPARPHAPPPAAPAPAEDMWPRPKPAPVATAETTRPPAVRRRNPLGRALRAIWSFTVSLAVMALFVGSWALAAHGVMQSERELIAAGALASVLFTPMAMARLTGGRYRAALLGSLAGSGLAMYLKMNQGAETGVALLAMFGFQVTLSWIFARMTRKRANDPLDMITD